MTKAIMTNFLKIPFWSKFAECSEATVTKHALRVLLLVPEGEAEDALGYAISWLKALSLPSLSYAVTAK